MSKIKEWRKLFRRAEKEPDPAKMRHLMQAISELLGEKDRKKVGVFTCRICDKPLCLETDTNTDEDGRAVHEECYLKHIAAPRPDNAMTE